MRKGLLLLGLLAVIISVSGCTGIRYYGGDYDRNCITGSGNVISKDFTLAEFHSISHYISGKVYITQAAEQSLRIEADDNVFDELTVSVLDGILTISSNRCFNTTKPVNVYVSMKDVRKLSLSASGNLIGQTEITSDYPMLTLSTSGSGSIDVDVKPSPLLLQLNTMIMGSGNIVVRGTTKNHLCQSAASGNVKAFDLKTETATVTLAGSGNAEVYASEELDVTITGSGSVFYKGSPEVRQTITGSGSVVKKVNGQLDNRCKLEPDPGICEAYMPRYYFNQTEGICKEFIWGGCGGTVPFETLEECQTVCEK